MGAMLARHLEVAERELRSAHQEIKVACVSAISRLASRGLSYACAKYGTKNIQGNSAHIRKSLKRKSIDLERGIFYCRNINCRPKLVLLP